MPIRDMPVEIQVIALQPETLAYNYYYLFKLKVFLTFWTLFCGSNSVVVLEHPKAFRYGISQSTAPFYIPY